MGYLISDLCNNIYKDDLTINITNEKEIARFSRVTEEPKDDTCVFVAEKRFLKHIPSKTKMIITTADISEKIENYYGGICVCDRPKVLFFRLANHLHKTIIENNEGKYIVGSNCVISKTAAISKNNVVIGNNVVIEDFVSVYPNTFIGDNTIICAGAKIGIQDYNYYTDGDTIIHIAHAGGVYIGEDVEIGYNTVIGRGLYYGDETYIGSDCKIAHNCCIGHDVSIGQHCMIYSGAVIGGNTYIGKSVHVTMNSTIKNGLKIGSGSTVCMGANVLVNVKEGTSVFGNPATRIKL